MKKILIALIAIFMYPGTASAQSPVINPIVGPANICWDPSVSNVFYTSASNVPLSYMWSVAPSASVFVMSQGSDSTAIFFGNINGTYTVYCTAFNSSGSSSTSFVVNVFQKPTVTFSGEAFFCQGSSTNLSASPTVIQASSTLNQGSTTLLYTWSPSTGLNTTVGPNVTASPTVTTTYTVSVLNGPCTTTEAITVIVDACTGIADAPALEQMQARIYPNPASDHVTLEITARNGASVHVELLNAMGQAILSDEVAAPQATYNLATLPRGIYFVTLRQNGAHKTLKLIKE